MKATLLVIPLKVCSFIGFSNQKSLGEKKVAFTYIYEDKYG